MSTNADHARRALFVCLAAAMLAWVSGHACAADAPMTNEDWLARLLDTKINVDINHLSIHRVLNSLVDLLPREDKDHFVMAFDWKALEDAGSGTDYFVDNRVALRANNLRLRSVLDFVLHPYDLGWTIQHEVLLITTKEKADAAIVVRVYDVEDLVVRNGDPNRTPNFRRLIEVITSEIAPTTWDEAGGPATIDSYGINGCRLAIGQTVSVHFQIAQFLADLRATPSTSPAEKKIKQALNEATQLEFVETPLSDVVDFLMDLHGIEIQLDSKALKEAGTGQGAPIVIKSKNIKLRTALWLMLQPLDMDYVVKDDVMLITTKEKAERLNAKLYPVLESKPVANPTLRGGRAAHPAREPQPARPNSTDRQPPSGGDLGEQKPNGKHWVETD